MMAVTGLPCPVENGHDGVGRTTCLDGLIKLKGRGR